MRLSAPALDLDQGLQKSAGAVRPRDTHEGRLLASAIGSGKSIDELDESAEGRGGALHPAVK